jgi:hypothetical protein
MQPGPRLLVQLKVSEHLRFELFEASTGDDAHLDPIEQPGEYVRHPWVNP